MTDKNEIFYSFGGIPQYFKSIEELFEYKVDSSVKMIKLNTSSQPNSIPHLGTLTTLMSVFAIAERLQKKFKNIPVIVEFDEIECSSSGEEIINGVKYTKTISDCYIENGVSISEHNMIYYKEILNFLSLRTKIPYSIRTYEEFQGNESVRNGLISVVNKKKFFISLFNTKDKLHIRAKCPNCNLIDKMMVKTSVEKKGKDSIIIISTCPKHGDYRTLITKTNTSFVEVNTQLRDLLKGGLIAAEKKRNNILTAMIDGGDWSGTWATRIHCEGMQELNKKIPIRLFSPLILDRSGGKLSKTIYLEGNSYSYLNDCYKDYVAFKKKFGDAGLDYLFKEVKNWVSEPKKFFRNYSIDYIQKVMKNMGK